MERQKNEYPRLGLTGIISAEKWQAMDERKRQQWVVKHANQVLPKLVKLDVSTDVATALTQLYDVDARYTLIDIHYNQRGEVLYQLEWSRSGKARIINI